MSRALIVIASLIAGLVVAVAIIFWSATAFWLAPLRESPTRGLLDDSYRFVETSCWFRIPQQQDIICGKLHTPVAAGDFALPVVRIRDQSKDHRSDPVIYLPGGPGGSAGLTEEGIHYWINWLAYANLGRDLILMEPRGVGLSQPRLACAAYDRFSLKVLKQDASLQQELAQSYLLLEQCFEQLNARGQVAGHYSTTQSAADLQALMQLLAQKNPSEQAWNLLGVSYGSRLAMVAAQNFPQVRSIILDSVYPPPHGGLHEWPALFEQSLQRYFEWCAATPHCHATGLLHPPSIERLLLALDNLRAMPVTVTVRRWDGEPPIDLVLNDHRFLSAVFAALYDVYDREKIVPAIEAVIQSHGENRRAALVELVEPFINNAFAEDFTALVFFAVDCHDHPPLPELDYLQQINNHPLFADYMRDLWRFQTCHFLSPENATGIQLKTMPTQPALLLAGTLDPITPVEWAQALHSQWSNSQLIVRDELGHAIINSDACVHRHLRQFLDAPHRPLKLNCDNP